MLQLLLLLLLLLLLQGCQPVFTYVALPTRILITEHVLAGQRSE
jgi:hypothetical protein